MFRVYCYLLECLCFSAAIAVLFCVIGVILRAAYDGLCILSVFDFSFCLLDYVLFIIVGYCTNRCLRLVLIGGIVIVYAGYVFGC